MTIRRPSDSSFYLLRDRRLGGVYPEPVHEAAALVDAEVAEGGPGHLEAGSDAGRQDAVLPFREQTLDVRNVALTLLDVLLDAALFDQRLDCRVAGLVALAGRVKAVEGNAALGPELGRQRAD